MQPAGQQVLITYRLEDVGVQKSQTCSTFLAAALPTAQPKTPDLSKGLLPHNHLHIALCHVNRGVHKPLVADAEEGWVLAGCAKAVVGGVEDVPPVTPG